MLKPSLKSLGAHTEGIWCVKWKDDNIITGSLDGTVKTWKDSDLSLVSSSESVKMGITSLAVSPHSSSIVCSCQDSIIRSLDADEGSIKMTEKWSINAEFLAAWFI